MLVRVVFVLMFNQQRPLPDVDQHSPIVNQLLQSGPFGTGATFECVFTAHTSRADPPLKPLVLVYCTLYIVL